MKKQVLFIITMHIYALFVCASTVFATATPASFETTLETLRQKYRLPALAAVVVRGNAIIATGAVGVRKADTDIPVTLQDQFFIGSCTKSMTATVAAWLVERGKIAWTTTIAEAFPQIQTIHRTYRRVTLEQLLSHTGGAPEDMDLEVLTARPGLALPTQRLAAIAKILAKPTQHKPDTEAVYSNSGYVIAAAMLEQAAGESWETLMQRILFTPLGMTSAGFGLPATPGNVDQPWGHHERGKHSKPAEPGEELFDQAVLLGPAGTVHASIGDFAKYAVFHLQQERLANTFLSAQSFRKLHAPVKKFRFDDDQYALGWVISEQTNDGQYIWHNGSDGMRNYAVILLAPDRDFAVAAATNIGGKRGMEGVHQTIRTLAQEYFQTDANVFPKMSNWIRIAGIGVGVFPVYPGSDEFKIAPAPFGIISYTTTYVDFFLNAAGLGVRLKEPEHTGLRLDIGVRPGEIRKPDADKVKEFLAGTPEVTSIIQPFVSLGREVSLAPTVSADLTATMRYAPAKADYDEAGRPDQKYNGLLVDTMVDINVLIPTYRILLNADIGATWMNGEYAAAFHSVHYPTATLEEFHADSGLRDVHTNFGVSYFITPRVGVTVQGGVLKLLGAVADSPLTKNDLQSQVSLMMLYNF